MKRFTLGLISLASAGCMHQTQPNPSVKNDGPVIVRIVSRDTTITARAGANGTVYSVSTNQGEQIIPDMTLNQLQAQHPDLAKCLRTFQADASSGAWAGLE